MELRADIRAIRLACKCKLLHIIGNPDVLLQVPGNSMQKPLQTRVSAALFDTLFDKR